MLLNVVVLVNIVSNISLLICVVQLFLFLPKTLSSLNTSFISLKFMQSDWISFATNLFKYLRPQKIFDCKIQLRAKPNVRKIMSKIQEQSSLVVLLQSCSYPQTVLWHFSVIVLPTLRVYFSQFSKSVTRFVTLLFAETSNWFNHVTIQRRYPKPKFKSKIIYKSMQRASTDRYWFHPLTTP